MNKLERVTSKIKADKEIMAQIKSSVNNYWSEAELICNFREDAERWIKAIKTHSMACVVKKVSSTGMSRVFIYTSAEYSRKFNRINFTQFNAFLDKMGYKKAGHDGIRVSGCGMDMNFNTNYNIIHKLQALGFMSKKVCAKLSQKTPTVL